MRYTLHGLGVIATGSSLAAATLSTEVLLTPGADRGALRLRYTSHHGAITLKGCSTDNISASELLAAARSRAAVLPGPPTRLIAVVEPISRRSAAA